jgi:hypothetical protein
MVCSTLCLIYTNSTGTLALYFLMLYPHQILARK